MKKYTFLLCSLLLFSLGSNAQKLRGLDKSPMDMIYYPDNFSHDRKFAPKPEWNDQAKARIIYSRPAKKEREIFGKLIPYDKIWRVGANEATEIKFYTKATVAGKAIKAGTYSLYIIPNEKEWTVIINSDLDQWGEYSYNQAKDVLRVNVPVQTRDELVENLTLQFRQAADKLNESMLIVAWDKTFVEIPINFKK